jgi:hypothetical protein
MRNRYATVLSNAGPLILEAQKLDMRLRRTPIAL